MKFCCYWMWKFCFYLKKVFFIEKKDHKPFFNDYVISIRENSAFIEIYNCVATFLSVEKIYEKYSFEPIATIK